MDITAAGVIPGIDSSFTLGTAQFAWSSVHADAFTRTFKQVM